MRHQRGLTLVELVVFIVVVGIAFAALLGAMNAFTRSSPDPLIRKQALAIAESLLEEVQLMPFTYCDPDDPAAATATGVGDCAAGLSEDSAPHPKVVGGNPRDRYSASVPFANVSDYSGFTMSGIRAIYDSATVVSGLDNYSVSVSVAATTLDVIPSPEALLVTVTVSFQGTTQVVLQGYRTRYAPNTGL